jgi:hypothetical protein
MDTWSVPVRPVWAGAVSVAVPLAPPLLQKSEPYWAPSIWTDVLWPAGLTLMVMVADEEVVSGAWKTRRSGTPARKSRVKLVVVPVALVA